MILLPLWPRRSMRCCEAIASIDHWSTCGKAIYRSEDSWQDRNSAAISDCDEKLLERWLDRAALESARLNVEIPTLRKPRRVGRPQALA
jgi:hypothetical protein